MCACNRTELTVLDDGSVKVDAPTTTDRVTPGDVATRDAVTPRDVVSAIDAVPPAPDVVRPAGTDDAVIERVARFPMSLGCSARATAMVTVRNTGTATWTTAAGYALGASAALPGGR